MKIETCRNVKSGGLLKLLFPIETQNQKPNSNAFFLETVRESYRKRQTLKQTWFALRKVVLDIKAETKV